ncbi:MAG: tRNA (adenosine(37)-N6)-dimethylallyltransferase MiaA [Xanthomonadales bacterium]|nr:tRNA (adenosine(37)-N6)-dimethylallyltransferase MiaA [Xanthomonadales bacterium]
MVFYAISVPSHQPERAASVTPLICIVGPTAAGKTEIALDLAERHGAEIISVDSALVYRGMDIGTAKPDADQLARVRHWLIDLREPVDSYSAADFVVDAEAAIADIQSRGRMPLLVGGTMLYLRALLQGLSDLPAANPELRAQLAAELAERGAEALHEDLARCDPAAAARIHRNDPQRLLRALEVFRQTGKPISELQGAWQQSARRPARLIALAPPDRSLLHRRIEQRFDAMLAAGFLDEMRELMSRPDMHPDLPAMRAVGYRQAWGHLAGDYDLARCRELSIYATRQLAKRQLTWLRGMADVEWFDPAASGSLEAISGRLELAGLR